MVNKKLLNIKKNVVNLEIDIHTSSWSLQLII
jgi:hypothetical protein